MTTPTPEQIAKDVRNLLDRYAHGPQESERWYATVEAVEQYIKKSFTAERARWSAFADENGEPLEVWPVTFGVGGSPKTIGFAMKSERPIWEFFGTAIAARDGKGGDAK